MHRQPQSCLSSLDSCPAASLPSSVPGCLAGIFSTLTHQNTAVFPKGSSPPPQSALHPPGCSDRCGSELCQTHFQHTQPGALAPPHQAPDSCGCFLTLPLVVPAPILTIPSGMCIRSLPLPQAAARHPTCSSLTSHCSLQTAHLHIASQRLLWVLAHPSQLITAPARPPTPHLQCRVPPFWG